MSIPSTSVKWMYAGMTGAPVLDNNWGDLTTLLRACAVTGFNLRPVQAITCSGSTATVRCNGHGFIAHQVVRIEGADPTGYNGEHRIVSVVDANTVTITLAAALAPASAAAGQTLQMRAAPLGFESLFDDGGQKLVLRSTNVQSPRNVLRVDASCPTNYTTTYAKFGRVTMAQGMSDLDTFVGARAPYDPSSPTKNEVPSGSGSSVYGGWFRWYYARNSDASGVADNGAVTSGARKWILVGDDRGFYLLTTTVPTSNTWRSCYVFSDFSSLQSPDAYATLLAAHNKYVTAGSAFDLRDSGTLVRSTATEPHIIMRDHTGEGGNVYGSMRSLNVTGGAFTSGFSTSVPYPNGPGGSLLVHPVWIQHADGNIRGRLPGVYHLLHNTTLTDLSIVDGKLPAPDRKLLIADVNSQPGASSKSQIALDITGPWGRE